MSENEEDDEILKQFLCRRDGSLKTNESEIQFAISLDEDEMEIVT